MDVDAILRESSAYFEALEEEGFDSSVEFNAESPDPIDPILTQLKPIGDATFAEWFTTLQSLMQESENLTDFQDRLLDTYHDLDAAEFKQAMLDASVVAGMRGYDDAASVDEGEEAAQFSELLGSIPSSEYPAILLIVNSHYTDGIDRLDNARLNDDGSLICVGIDGNKQVAAKITDTKISIRLLNTDAEFATPKSNGSLKKKACKTGLSCGGTCISKSKVCARALSIEQQKQFKELKKRLKAGDSEAQKGIENLKSEQQGSRSQKISKSEVKVETKSTTEPKKMTTSTTPASRQKAMFVNIEDIKTDSKASDFNAKEIDLVANSILQAGGLYRPLLISQDETGYKLFPGHELAYHASIRAKELDIKKAEEANAFIVSKDHAQSSEQQVDRLRGSEPKLSEPEGDFIKPFRSSGLVDKKAMWVETSAIKSSRPASDFDPKEIEDLADSILANGGLLRPMVLAQKTYDTYEVLDGHLAYHASVRAKQKDPRQTEEVNGFVISPDNIQNVMKQLKMVK
jgi:hypothetical protein